MDVSCPIAEYTPTNEIAAKIINRTEQLLSTNLRTLRKLANDIHRECTKNELVIMILDNEFGE